MSMGTLGWIVGGIVLVVVLWWWLRPVHWQDAEGQSGPDNSLEDTDVGSVRWWFFGTGKARWYMGFAAWFENTFRRRR